MQLSRQPHNAHKLCSYEKVKNLLLLLLLMLICINSHFFWTYGLEEEAYLQSSGLFFWTFGSYYNESFRHTIWPLLDLSFSAILPGIFIVLFVAQTLKYRYVMKRNISEVENNGSINNGSLLSNVFLLDPCASDKFVICTIALGICACIFSLPSTSYNIFEFVVEKLHLEIYGELHAKRALAQTVCYTFRDIFLSCKVFIYLSFWPPFPNEIKNKLICKKRHSSHKRIFHHDNRCSATQHLVPCDECPSTSIEL